jgi:hypothetical protein
MHFPRLPRLRLLTLIFRADAGVRHSMAADDWPELPESTETAFASRLVDYERERHPLLASDEMALGCLQEQLRLHYASACHAVERLRASKNLSRSRLTGLRRQLGATIAFLAQAVPCFARLAADLLDRRAPAHLRRLYAGAQEAFRGASERIAAHFAMHIARGPPGAGARIPARHLLRLRALLDDAAAALTATLAPIAAALSMRLAPVVGAREAFFRAQMASVAEKQPKIAQIRTEMQLMVERRRRLKTVDGQLARMFDVLVSFKPALGRDEEDEDLDEELDVGRGARF